MSDPPDSPDEDAIRSVVYKFSVPRHAFRTYIEEHWEDRFKRDNSLFTDRDRRFLWGLKTYDSESYTSQVRGEIRDRLKAGLLDLFLLPLVPESKKQEAIEDIEEEEPAGTLLGIVASFIHFAYLAIDRDIEKLERMISHGVHQAEETHEAEPYSGDVDSVSVNIEVSREADAEEIYERYKRGDYDYLTPEEIGVLVRRGFLDADDLKELEHKPLQLGDEE